MEKRKGYITDHTWFRLENDKKEEGKNSHISKDCFREMIMKKNQFQISSFVPTYTFK